MKKICVLIPCYNEEAGIGIVMDNMPSHKFKNLGYEVQIIVIDNNSKDKTAKIAREKGAQVFVERKQGKGNAMKTGFNLVGSDVDYVVMLDGDATYRAQEIPRMLEPLESGFCDVIIGSRLEGKLNGEALSISHRLANWVFTFIVRVFYLTNTTDICTGFFAWKREVIEELVPHITSRGFAIEAEMITKMAKLGFSIYSVPITYDAREGDSKLSPVSDGLKILWMLLKNLVWRPQITTSTISAYEPALATAEMESLSESSGINTVDTI